MIPITWPKDPERRALVEDLFIYLLTQTIPFPKGAYLPKDENGTYYYCDFESEENPGARVSVRNPKELSKENHTCRPLQEFYSKNRVALDDYLFMLCEHEEKEFIHKNKKGKLEYSEQKLPSSPEVWIFLFSLELYVQLYGTPGALREKLQPLLFEMLGEDVIAGKAKVPDWTRFKLRDDLPQEFGDSEQSRKLFKTLLQGIFGYERLQKKPLFNRLVQSMNVPVCPYCNRALTTTVQTSPGGSLRQNQMDHYLPKDIYPSFSVSLYNLIPSCANCNHQKRDSTALVLYPYREGLGDALRFRTVPLEHKSFTGYLTGQPNAADAFEIELRENPERTLTAQEGYLARVAESRKQFALEDVYRDSHKEFLLSLFRQRHVFGDAYVQDLINSFPDLFSSEYDVRKTLYLREFAPDKWGEAPLAKLTHDVDEEISECEKLSRDIFEIDGDN